jgi:hypothetical protein
LRALRKLSENGDDSRLFFRRSSNLDVLSFVPFSVVVVVVVEFMGTTFSKLGHGDNEFCLYSIVVGNEDESS